MQHRSRQRIGSAPGTGRGLSRRGLLGGALGLGAVGALSACASSGQAVARQAADGSTIVRYQSWPNTVLGIELAEALGHLDGVSLERVGSTNSGPADIQAVATGSSEIGYAFTGAVIKLVEAGADIRAVAHEYGIDHLRYTSLLTAEDSPVHGPRDVIGGSVAMNTLGANAEAYVSTWLRRGGLTEEEIETVTLVAIPPNDVAQNVRRGHVLCGAVSGIPQQVAATQGGLREISRETDLYDDTPAGQVVLRGSWARENPEAADVLATGVHRAMQWAAGTPLEEAIERLTEIVAHRGRGESTQPLQYWRGTGLPGSALMADEDFTLWEPWLRASRILDGPVDAGRYYTNEHIRA